MSFSYPNSRDSSSNQEIRPYDNPAERDKLESLGELYAVINSIECLEKAFAGDYVSKEEYHKECTKLLAQYKLMIGETQIEKFIRKYRVNCPLAIKRVKEGKPVTINDGGSTALRIAQVTELFITFLDLLRLNTRDVDALHPTLSDLNDTIIAMTNLPATCEPKSKVAFWFNELNKMNASDTITDDMAREMVFQLDNAYNILKKMLEH
uniref:Vacuolar protein sorting-associated protein 28 homolog n=1 Tax=Rhabditophanes sp. KR3021 TaxID=114890 RepID=A0AC35UAD9_9BILA